MSQSRQLAAIMFTDIVGYTALMGEDSNRALRLLQKSKEIQKPLVKKYHGQWLKEMGDGALTKFSTATDALACALEIQRASRADFEATYRIGIHLGDITLENGDVFGDGVNVASRLEAIADPGGIYISESIEKAIRGQMKIDLKFLGEKKLKNVNYEVRTYAVQGVGLPLPDQQPNTNKRISKDSKLFKRAAAVVIGLLLIGWSTYLWNLYSNNSQTSITAIHLQIALPENVYLAAETDYPVLDISPDGSSVVFVGVKSGRRDLYIKKINQPGIDIIEGTENALHPFYSPDGSWIGFVRGTILMKIPANGGVPIPLHEITPMNVNRGLTWYQEDSVVITPSADGGLSIGFTAGNEILPITAWRSLLSSEPSYWPKAINEIDGIIYTDFRSNNAEDQSIYMYSMKTGETRHLIDGGTFPSYSSNKLLFVRNGQLLVSNFDLEEMQVEEAKVIIKSVYTNVNGSALYAVGGSNLAYVSGRKEIVQDQLVWVDMVGNTELILSDGRDMDFPRISPSGNRIAVTVIDGPNSDLWMFEMNRNTLSRLTSHPGEDFGPVWHPNEKWLAFSSEIAQSKGEEGPGIAFLEINSNHPPQRYLFSPGFGHWEFPLSWSSDGSHILFAATKGSVNQHLEVMDFEKKNRSVWHDSEAKEGGAVISPDGQWVAYMSNSTGRDEIYLRQFDGQGRIIQVSVEGGSEPVWSRDGKAIYFRAYDRMMSVSIIHHDPLKLSKPVLLFEKPFKRVDYGGYQANYDISPDGDRFVMIQNTSEIKPQVIDVILNWSKL